MENQHSSNQDKIHTDTGSQLRQARIAGGVELDTVAAALCIPSSYVTAIEHNDLAELPAAVFVRGYVSAYARFLGISLDGEIAVQDDRARSKGGKRLGLLGGIKRQTRPSDPWVRWTSLSVVAVVVVASLLWWQSQGDPREAGLALPQVAVVTVDTGAGSVVVNPDDQASALGPASSRLVGQSTPTDAPVVVVENQRTEEPGIGGAEMARIPESVLEQVALDAVFSDASWIEVRDAANSVLFTGVKQAGETLSLSSTAMVDVVIGNAAAVKLSYNSAPVDITPFTDERNVAKIKLGL